MVFGTLGYVDWTFFSFVGLLVMMAVFFVGKLDGLWNVNRIDGRGDWLDH